MAQLRLAYPEIQNSGAEILQVTHSTPEEARVYFRRHQLAFPYLCDPDRAVHALYGVPIAPKGLVEGMQMALASAAAGAADLLLRGETTPSPLAYARRYGPRNQPEQAVFIVNREGIVRYVHTSGPISAIPSNAELLSELARLQ